MMGVIFAWSFESSFGLKKGQGIDKNDQCRNLFDPKILQRSMKSMFWMFWNTFSFCIPMVLRAYN